MSYNIPPSLQKANIVSEPLLRDSTVPTTRLLLYPLLRPIPSASFFYLPSHGSRQQSRRSESVPRSTMDLVRNVLPQRLSRYVTLGSELLVLLQERYGDHIDFCIAHENDRWYFDCPEQLQEVANREIVTQIADRRDAAREAARRERRRRERRKGGGTSSRR
ncbi:hypothetical protein CABS01_11503 [Colletotrichum abscissum]|uniref:Uncharacterized protein n=1 Tax=Colletotrichum melonis TaxID=1209925 RepID=A0AAI9UCF7_9PEZI|nr:uncharacterized protein CABS01_11503 [Colletotrichum abscissum]KAK1453485.1 hypothetical protein CMEL01_05144 [Colletotrichum melonis]KAK1494487.1 hypothetical protein CABS01_11503 [Colletotrichum abscissum]